MRAEALLGARRRWVGAVVIALVERAAAAPPPATCQLQQQGSELVTTVTAHRGGLTLTITNQTSLPPPSSSPTATQPRSTSHSRLAVARGRHHIFTMDAVLGEITMTFGQGKRHHHQADLHIAGTQVTGEIDGRQVVFSAQNPKSIKYADGKPPSKWRLSRSTLSVLKALSLRAERVAHTCTGGSSAIKLLDNPGASSECDQCTSSCDQSYGACLAGAAGASIGCGPFFMVCGAGGGALCEDMQSHCDNDCTDPGGACCPVFCTDGTFGSCCDQGATCCGASCFDSVCSGNQTCCGDGGCCDAGTTCADASQRLCCPGVVQACGKTCCPQNAGECRDPSGPLCCPFGGGPVCGDVCCAMGQVCQLQECCAPQDICPGASGECCPSPHICLGSQCCDPPSTVCVNTATHTSTCCGEFDTCIPVTGICCGKLTGIPCGLFCCNGDTERCASNQCCPKDQACGSVCCPAGQRCTDPTSGTCSPCPAGEVACQPIGTAPSTCCAPGQGCCPGGPDTGGPVCCTEPAQQTCCGVPDNICHFESFCIR